MFDLLYGVIFALALFIVFVVAVFIVFVFLLCALVLLKKMRMMDEEKGGGM